MIRIVRAKASVRRVTMARPRSRVASGARFNGRLPRYVYGLVLRQMPR
jgi:hypothetical protein